MSRCGQEECPNWDGDGCPCKVFGIEPGEARAVYDQTWGDGSSGE